MSSQPIDVQRPSTPGAAFYFDLSCPLSYLVAERVLQRLPVPATWTPILARDLPEEREPPTAKDLQDLRSHVEVRARELGLQPVRWPDPFPFDSELAMRVATYARSIGRAVPFAQAAFRQAFAGGRSLADSDNLLIAAAACEMHPAAVLRGAQLRSVSEQLAATTAHAARLGVQRVPTILVEGHAFVGEDAPERAAAHLRAEAPAV